MRFQISQLSTVPKQNFTAFCPAAQFRLLRQDPLDLGGRKIRIQYQTGRLTDVRLQPVTPELFTDRSGSAALPDNGTADGLSGCLFPEDGGFPLIGDSNGNQF